METLFFLLFCFAIGYVCLWVIVNERQGNLNGDWGFIAMRLGDPAKDDPKPRQDRKPALERDFRR